MVRRYELSGDAFGLFEDLLPPCGSRGLAVTGATADEVPAARRGQLHSPDRA
jgi:hypothetical protein